MKIAFIGQKGVSEEEGTLEYHVTELATGLRREGHRVTIFARRWFQKTGGVFNGCNVRRLPSLKGRYTDSVTHAFVATMYACLFRSFDVMHFQGSGSALFCWMPRLLRPSAMVVVTFHAIERHQRGWGPSARAVLHLAEVTAIRYAHQVTAVTGSIANYLAVTHGVRASHIPYAAPVKRLAVNSALVRTYGAEPFAYALAEAHDEQVPFVMQAWRMAVQAMPHVPVRLLILTETNAETSLYAGHDGISVVQVKDRDAREALFAASAFVIEAAANHVVPVKLMHAMSYGKAVIAADTVDRMEILREVGVPYMAGSVQDLAAAMVGLMGDAMQTAALGHEARCYVEEVFHGETLAQEYLDIYNAHIALREGVLAIR